MVDILSSVPEGYHLSSFLFCSVYCTVNRHWRRPHIFGLVVNMIYIVLRGINLNLDVLKTWGRRWSGGPLTTIDHPFMG